MQSFGTSKNPIENRSSVAARRGLAFLLTLLCTGCGAWKRFGYEGVGRDRWQEPDRVLDVLGVAQGAAIADLGAGGGYFSFRFADRVGRSGRVYAIDVDPDMLAYLEARRARASQSNLSVVRASFDDPGIPDASVDLLFTCNTYHHFEDRRSYFAKLKRVLRPGGRVAVIETRPGEGWIDWTFGHSTRPDTIRTELEAAGYQLEARHDFLSRQSFLVFRPEGS